ncbi:preprotein translocase subunit YajC [Brevundimonas diminuta]|uniref:Sec translocon accessory complex subunit YajC n=1 Tax=Brevundimonas naejangsanensis TaxID=588932 RepID=A0A172Y4P9_9CAUL|nr:MULTISPECIES: preprotein translocase subunit YajC [Brevundimonas]ANF54200.1 preprotein translocase subunit YajC [Brevundimonas naejangsanensis]MCO8029768.1 preprotein translocase subunit YajC [Brevundimonas diminuta]QBQ48064.1 preprotein translocase subunit YajC [Brevundimonas naejangsanensis]
MTAAQDGGLMALVVQIAPIVAIFILFYFLMIRPQQKRMKAHQALIAGVKRGDEVVLSNGMVGKVTRVEDAEAMVEISQGVNVRVVKAMIAEVRNRTAIAANDKG